MANCKNCRSKFIQKNMNYRYCNKSECREAGLEFVNQKKEQELDRKVKKALAAARKNIANAEKEKFSKMKENVTDYKGFLQKNINNISKLIDYGLRGLHETKEDIGIIQAGHIYSVKNNEVVRFNLHNIHRQGAKSNMAKVFDEELRDALMLEYGNEYLQYVKSIKYQPPRKLMQHEFKEAHFKAISIKKRLQLDLKKYSKVERIEMRNSMNKELGIYPDEYTQFNINNLKK